MTLDPRWSIFLACFLALLGYFAGAGSLLTDIGFDPGSVKKFLALITLFMGAGNTVLAVLTGIPSKDNQTGFIVKGPPPPPKP